MLSLGLTLISVGAGLFGAVRCIQGDLYLGFGSLIAGAAALRLAPGLWPIDDARGRGPSRTFGLLAVAATLVFFRFYRLVPPGLWGDDALNGLLAFDVLDGKVPSPAALVSHAHSRFHALTNYAIAASFAALGPDLASLRIPGAVIGCVGGMFVYGIARHAFGATTAVFAGLLFATSPMQIAHSKNLTQVVLGLTFQCAGVYTLLRGVDARSRGWLGMSAAAMAGTFYTYHAAKLAPFVALPVLASALWRRDLRLRDTVVPAAVFVLCLLPALIALYNDPGALLGRAQEVSILDEVTGSGSIAPLARSTLQSLGIFHVAQGPTKYSWFGPGKDPALTPVCAALVLPGLLASLAGWRQPRHQLLLWWFVVGLAPAVFSTDAPRGYRALLSTPPVFIWAALPLVAMWNSRSARAPLRVVAAALVIAGTLIDYNYYFHRAYTDRKARWMAGERIVEMARMARTVAPDGIGYVMSPTFGARHETFRLLSRMWGIEFQDASSLAFALEDSAVPEAGAVFLTAPGSHPAASELESLFAGATRTTRSDPEPYTWWGGGVWPYAITPRRPEPIAAGLFVRRSAVERYRSVGVELPVRRTCDGDEGERREPIPFYDFFANTFHEARRCTWNARLEVPAPGPVTLRWVADPPLQVRSGGVPVPNRGKIEAGVHEIALTMTEPAKRVRLRLYWTLPHRSEQLIPRTAWRSSRTDASGNPDSGVWNSTATKTTAR